MIGLITEATSVDDINALQKCFFGWFRTSAELPPKDNPKLHKDGLKALLIVLSLALQNVQDISGKETVELCPFIMELTRDDYFKNSMQLVAIIVFGIAETKVSISNYAWCC